MKEKEATERALRTLEEEKKALQNLKNTLNSEFKRAISLLEGRTGNILVTGVGKSGFIAEKIAATLTSLGNRALFLNPTDALHGDSGIIGEGDILIAISFSGETAEIIKVVRHAKDVFHSQVVSITGDKKSKLARLSDSVLLIKINKEGDPLNLAPMASTTASLVLGDMIASALLEPKNFQKEHFVKFHPHGTLGFSLKKVSEVMVSGKEIPIIEKGSSLTGALKVMTRGKRGVVGIVDKNRKLLGIITDGDIRRIILENKEPQNLPVESLMTKKPKVITKESSLKEALSKMEQYKITSFFVCDKSGAVEGLLHIRHIMPLLQ